MAYHRLAVLFLLLLVLPPQQQQHLALAAPPTVLISEVARFAGWVELYNAGPARSLAGFSLLDSAGARYTLPGSVSVGANGFVLLSRTSSAPPCGVVWTGVTAISYNSYQGSLRLYDPNNALLDCVGWSTRASFATPCSPSTGWFFSLVTATSTLARRTLAQGTPDAWEVDDTGGPGSPCSVRTRPIQDVFLSPLLNRDVWLSSSGAVVGTRCGASVGSTALQLDNGTVAVRSVTTVPLNTLSLGIDRVRYDILVPGGWFGECERADYGENVAFEFSNDNRASWITLNVAPPLGITFRTVNVPLPVEAKQARVQFRWRQLKFTKTTGTIIFDTCALDNIAMYGVCLPGPCLHGGVCTATEAGEAMCDCSQLLDWKGAHCEVPTWCQATPRPCEAAGEFCSDETGACSTSIAQPFASVSSASMSQECGVPQGTDPSGSSLVFAQAGTRQALTYTFCAPFGGVFSFWIRLGEGSLGFCERVDYNDPIRLEARRGIEAWQTLEQFDPNFSGFKKVEYVLPSALHSNQTTLRLIQPQFSGSNYDAWAIFDPAFHVFVENGTRLVQRGSAYECEDIDYCEPQPCANVSHGIGCRDLKVGHECLCPQNATLVVGASMALACECSLGLEFDENNTCVDTDGCALLPCTRVNEVCVDVRAPGTGALCFCPQGAVENSTHCTCPVGTRLTASATASAACVEIDECIELGVSCLNGGTCVDERANFTCQCRVGFRGRFCEQSISELVYEGPRFPSGEIVDVAAAFQTQIHVSWSSHDLLFTRWIAVELVVSSSGEATTLARVRNTGLYTWRPGEVIPVNVPVKFRVRSVEEPAFADESAPFRLVGKPSVRWVHDSFPFTFGLTSSTDPFNINVPGPHSFSYEYDRSTFGVPFGAFVSFVVKSLSVQVFQAPSTAAAAVDGVTILVNDPAPSLNSSELLFGPKTLSPLAEGSVQELDFLDSWTWGPSLPTATIVLGQDNGWGNTGGGSGAGGGLVFANATGGRHLLDVGLRGAEIYGSTTPGSITETPQSEAALRFEWARVAGEDADAVVAPALVATTDQRIFRFGGLARSQVGEAPVDAVVHEFNRSTARWTPLLAANMSSSSSPASPIPSPSPRWAHGSFVLGGTLYVVGGRDAEHREVEDASWSFNLSSHEWTLRVETGYPRLSFAAVVGVGDGVRAISWGGTNATVPGSNELLLFDGSTWAAVGSGAGALPRVHSAAVAVEHVISSNTRVAYAVGGFDADSGSMSNVLIMWALDEPSVPVRIVEGRDCSASARLPCLMGHAAVIRPLNGARALTVVGGVTARGVLNEAVWLGSTNGTLWERQLIAGPSPRKYAAAAVVPTGTELIVFYGGEVVQTTTSVFLDDMWALQPRPILVTPSPLLMRSVEGSVVLALRAYNLGVDASLLAVPGACSANITIVKRVEQGELQEALECVTPPGAAANVTAAVKITIQGLVSLSSSPVTFYSYLPPRIDAVSFVGVLNTSGGSEMWLNGAEFSPSAVVVLGADTLCLSPTRENASFIQCRVPPGSGSGHRIAVRQANQEAVAAVFLSYAVPLVLSVSPREFVQTRGETLTIAGENFGDTVEDVVVQIGDLTCTVLPPVTHTRFMCQLQAGVGANLPLRVTVSDQTVVVGDALSFAPPQIFSIDYPRTGVDGNTRLTILGSAFGPSSAAAKVFIGNLSCSPVFYVDFDHLECLTPPLQSSDVDARSLAVRVRVGGLATVEDFRFSYAEPVITDLIVSGSRSTRGGASLVITGIQLGNSVVKPVIQVGEQVQCENVTFIVMDKQVKCDVPSGAGVGLIVSVVVGGVRSSSKAWTFDYLLPRVTLVQGPTDGLSMAGGDELTVYGDEFGVDDEVTPAVAIGASGEAACATTLRRSFNELVCVTNPNVIGAQMAVTVRLANAQSDGSQSTAVSSAPPLLTSLRFASALVCVNATRLPPSLSVIDEAEIDVGGYVTDACVKQSSDGSICCARPDGVGLALPVRLRLRLPGFTIASPSDSTFVASFPLPVISSVEAVELAQRSTRGGWNVTILGDRLALVTSIYPCTPTLLVRSPDRIVCRAAPGTGSRPVRAHFEQNITVQQQAGVLAYAPPSITSVRRNASAPSAPIEVTGHNFGPPGALPTPVVFIGDVLCGDVRRLSHERLVCLPDVAAQVGRDLEVRVVVDGQVSAVSPGAAAVFSFPPPHIDSILPLELEQLKDAQELTIRGTGFGLNATLVEVSPACASVRVTEPGTEIRCLLVDVSPSDGDIVVRVSVQGQLSNSVRVPFAAERAVAVELAMRSIGGVLATAYAASVMLALKERHDPVWKASSILFTSLVAVGALVMVATIFTLEASPINRLCHESIFLAVVGFTVAFGSLVLKNWRILAIFKASEKLRRLSIQDRDVLLRLLGLLIVDFLLLFPIIDQSKCGDSSASSTALACGIVLLCTKLYLLGFGIVTAVRSRVIGIDRFRERVQLGYAIVVVAVGILVVAPMSLVVGDAYVAVYLLRCIALILTSSAMVGFLFVPKIYEWWLARRRARLEEAIAHNKSPPAGNKPAPLAGSSSQASVELELSALPPLPAKRGGALPSLPVRRRAAPLSRPSVLDFEPEAGGDDGGKAAEEVVEEAEGQGQGRQRPESILEFEPQDEAPEWTRHVSDDGIPYWHHPDVGSVWEKPDEVDDD